MKVKNKTRKIVMKRFKITSTGKVMRRTPTMRHLRRKKGKRAIRRFRKYVQVSSAFAKKIKSMLNIK